MDESGPDKSFNDTPSDSNQIDSFDYIILFFRYLLIIILLGLVIFFVIDSYTSKETEKFIKYLGLLFIHLSPFYFILTYLSMTILFTIITVPEILIAATGGYFFALKFGFVFGILIGSSVNIIGITLGAMVCYFLSFALFHDSEYIKSYEYLNGLDIVLKKNGLLINILLRLTPILPQSVLNYSLPALGSNFFDFSIGCLLGLLPYSILVTVIGALIANHEASAWKSIPLYVTVLIGIVATLILLGVIIFILSFTSHEIEKLKSKSDAITITTNAETEVSFDRREEISSNLSERTLLLSSNAQNNSITPLI